MTDGVDYGGDTLLVREREYCLVEVVFGRATGKDRSSVDGQWRQATTVRTGTVFVVVDGSLVRKRGACVVEGIDGKRVLLVSRDSQQQYYL